MNSLYTLGVRQTNSIQADLERLRNGDTSAALLGLHVSAELITTGDILMQCSTCAIFVLYMVGQISASLAAMNRTVDDYDSMAKREMMKAKQEKAQM